MSFGAPLWLWGLLVLPLLVFAFIRAEQRGARRLEQFVAPRLLPELAGTVNHFRRILKFTLLLSVLAFVLISLARPRWGYAYDETKRKGLDLILAVDTSRSMLSNDVQPNRLERVKLAAQDLINELQGERVGLIAFAGRAFLQAPLTIDYDAAVTSITDLDTKSIPEGGTNISEAIALAIRTYGKSAIGNRALIIFTDGEELSGDAVTSAKTAAAAGVRIFTVGIGTREGSLIPIKGEEGGTAFVKDSKGQVVKSRLDETRLQEIAKSTGGFYLHLENGPRTMKQLFIDGLGKMQAGEIDARLSRRPIERYEWPLAVAIIALAVSLLINDRKRSRQPTGLKLPREITAAAAAVFLLSAAIARATSPGLEFYRQDKFHEAYDHFEQTLKENPDARQADRIEFDAGAAAYKMKDYGKALESFSQALLSRDPQVQSKSQYNLGNTLYEHGETQKSDAKKLTDWTDALRHYEQTLKLEPKNQEARDNYEFVKKKIEELKKKQEQSPTPTPTPTPSPSPQKNQKQDQKQKDKQQQSSDQKQDQKQQDQQQQSQNQQGSSGNEDKKSGKGEDKSQEQSSGTQEQKNDQAHPSPTPSPEEQKPQGGESPSPSPADQGAQNKNEDSQKDQAAASPSPGGEGSPSPTPSAEEPNGTGQSGNPTPTPAGSPAKPLTGEVKGASDEKPTGNPAQLAEASPEKEGEMSEKQAQLLLQSMKDEEQKVQLDERKAARHVYNDW
ncbi:MAG TPA: VWA domain-containing protein [Chthoniobacterales bacterium]